MTEKTKTEITWQITRGKGGMIHAGRTSDGIGYVVEPWLRFGHRIGWLASQGDSRHVGLFPTLREAGAVCEADVPQARIILGDLCPACDAKGPHDSNGERGALKSYACTACGTHWDPAHYDTTREGA
jgi:hypothetical protein